MRIKMNLVKVKGAIASNIITNYIAEWILDGYTLLRKKMTGGYTKNKEDITALRLLEQCTNKPIKDIKYIDIGANHYRRGNNSYLFYENGARGILVEADPILCEKLRKNRKEDKVVNIAVGGGWRIRSFLYNVITYKKQYG